jgi:hypothetical protein
MKAASSSYRVQYDLRPAKQVERRMFIDALQRLSAAGFPIHDYEYTGFGAIYFVDFILFHKLLGFRYMTSIEAQKELESRVLFNKPFEFVTVTMETVSAVIPSLSRDRRHVLWLDYDGALSADKIGDISTAMTYLSPGSIVLITVDVEPPPISSAALKAARNSLPAAWRKYFEREAFQFVGPQFKDEDFTKSRIPRTNTRILDSVIRSGLVGRADVGFAPLFHFLYKDGSNLMLTLGGMIATPDDLRKIKGSTLSEGEAKYVRRDFKMSPYRIVVPKLTRKERIYMEAAMPCANGWRPAEFDIEDEIVSQYRDIYRFFPAYAEILL